MAATNHTIEFLNGSSTGTIVLPVGTYSYGSNNVPGYADGTVNQFTITPATTSVSLEITANGTLTVLVKDDLDDPITAGVLQLSDETGATRYGDTENITDGESVFANVPYLATTGIDFYIAQNSSDANHVPITDPQAVSMELQEQTETIINERLGVTVEFTMEDANYAGITPVTGDLVVNG